MTALPEVQLAPLAPVAFAAIGSMVVLLGEVLLTRAGVRSGRIGDLLAICAIFFLSLSFYTAFASFDVQPQPGPAEEQRRRVVGQ